MCPPDLSPPDYFLWTYLKSLVYKDCSKTLEDLRDNIRAEIGNIPVDMLDKVTQSFRNRLVMGLSTNLSLILLDAGSTGIGKGTTFVMARFKIPVEVFTLSTLTRPSLPGNTSKNTPHRPVQGLGVGIL
ncbi:uncharacterized protein TNCV_370181 [Trichonephila clavipes]|nr:uncharacterized protein TNCV_370181 [Trichonephila clavipes]